MGQRRGRGRGGVARPIHVEVLEERLLLSGTPAVITDIAADNRGQIELTVSRDLVPVTVSSSSVRVYTAGADGLLGTVDDTIISTSVSYETTTRTIRALAAVDPDERYRVEVLGDEIRGTDGCYLDAEFNGPGVPTGDGTEGGTLEFFTRDGVAPVVRFSTIFGDIDVELFPQETPLTVQNFFAYMNLGDWDNTIFHRSASLQDGTPFVIQGGGFESNSAYTTVPQMPPVQNEPGISNVRGTIAMAKLGNNPNSATSQWFFNIGDNSANLDNQNGGFTVFGEITGPAGLSVMDMIAALETVDATMQNGAFGDMPVLDAMAVEDRGGLVVPSDTVVVTRIARLYEVSAEAFNQLPTEGLVRLTDGGEAGVTIFSLNGVSLGPTSAFLDVRFSGPNKIASITITGPIPSPIGIQITGSQDVGSIIDRRGGSVDSNLRFIVSEGSIGNLRLSSGLAGTDLNGVLLDNNVLLREDVDGDGVLGDLTAVVVSDGSLGNARLNGSLLGSIVASEGLLSLDVRGRTFDADMVLGPATSFAASRFRFESVRDTSITTATPIAQLMAGDLLGFARIEAPSIGRLNVGGRTGSGDSEVDIATTGADGSSRTLGGATIRGAAVRSTWTIAGDSGTIRLDDGAGNWTLQVQGDLGGVTTKAPIMTSSVLVGGHLVSLRAAEWIGGQLEAGSATTIRLNGGRNWSGDLFAEVRIDAVGGTSVRSFQVGGDVVNSLVTLLGETRSFQVRGDVFDSELAMTTSNLRFNQVSDTTLTLGGAVRQLTAVEWLDGLITGGTLERVFITGNRKLGLEGDFSGNYSSPGTDNFTVAGSVLGGNLNFLEISRFQVNGDVEDATINFTQRTLRAGVGVATIEGSLIDSTIFGRGSTGAITVGAMVNSQMNLGTFQQSIPFGFSPANAATFFNANITAELVSVTGLGDGSPAMVNSFIQGGTIQLVRISMPDTTNGGMPFGVAARVIRVVETVLPGGGFRVTDPTTPPDPVGDYEIRPNFVAPS